MSTASEGQAVADGNVKLGIVCPMANERETAVGFVREVLQECSSKSFGSITFFAVLDNACKDGTRDLLTALLTEEPRLSVVWAPENRNVVDAYIRGYRTALENGCDWVLEIDAGYSHQPSDIPQFFSMMAKGYDCVFGSRFCGRGAVSETSFKRRVLSHGGTLLANAILGTRLTDMTSGFELFSRRALKNVLEKGIYSKGHFFQTEIKTHCRRMNIA